MHKDIEVTDPRGWVVRCSGEYWERHILVKHPDLEGCEAYAERALKAPANGCILASKTDPNRHIYYGELRNRIEIKVVVDFTRDEGIVVSVTACSKRPDGERLIWPP